MSRKGIMAFFFMIILAQGGLNAYFVGQKVDQYLQNRRLVNSSGNLVENVNVCIVQRGEFVGIQTAQGNIRAQNYMQVRMPKINTPDTKVARIGFETGQKVSKGDVLLVLHSEIAKNNLVSARLKKDQKRDAYERMCRAGNSVSEHDKSNALSLLQQAESELAAQEAYNASLIIRAPFDGHVGDCSVVAEECPEAGAVLFSVIGDSELMIEFHIENDAVDSVYAGKPIYVETVDENYITEAQVIGIVPYTEKGYNKTKVIAKIPVYNTIDNQSLNSLIFKHNMLAKVKIIKDPIEDVFTIPKKSIMEQGNSKFVLRVVARGDGTDEIKCSKVEIVDDNNTCYAIVSHSVSDDDKIVVEGAGPRSVGKTVHVNKILDIT